MNVVRFYFLFLRNFIVPLIWMGPLLFNLGKSLEFGEITGSAFDQFPVLISRAAIVFTAFGFLYLSFVQLRADWMKVIYTLPLQRKKPGEWVWLFYVWALPITQTLLIYAGSESETQRWADRTILHYGVTCLAFHATLFSAATITRQLDVRFICVFFVMVAAVIDLTGTGIIFRSMPLAVLWMVLALIVSFVRRSHLAQFDPLPRETFVEPSFYDLTAAGSDSYFLRPVQPPPLPVTGKTRPNKASVKFPRFRGGLQGQFFQIFGFALGLGVIIAAGMISLSNPTSSSAWIIFAASGAGIAAVLFERRRFNVYRTLPLHGHARCIYAVTIALAPVVAIFIVASPILAFASVQKVQTASLGLLLAAGVALSVLAISITTTRKSSSRGMPALINFALGILQFGMFWVFMVMLAAEPLFERIQVYVAPLVLVLGCTLFYVGRYRTRDI